MPKVRISQIFSHSMEDVVAAKKALDTGGAFEEIVQQFSSCPSKSQGGDLGWMPEGNARELLGKGIDQTQCGEILGPIHSQYGYHILKITELEGEQIEGSVSGETPMSEINKSFPDIHTLLFKEFHIGLPLEGYNKGETLADVCNTHGKQLSEVLHLVNAKVAEQSIPTITPQELKALLDSNAGNITLLDIREKWERDISCIENSLHITQHNNEEILARLSPDREMILIDWNQDRSAHFQKWLAHKGFTNVKALEGGIDAWADKVDTKLARYEIDEDDGYRYEDILAEDGGDDHDHHDH